MKEDFLAQKLRQRDKANNLRKLPDSSEGIDFSSNDYLGLASSQLLQDNILKRLSSQSIPNGSTGSRLLTGNSSLHEETEHMLADFFRAECSLLFSSGYVANLALLSTIPQRGDTILYDDFCHTSIKEGIRLSTARFIRFKHNSPADLERKLSKASGRKFIVVESVYSMDGDICDFESVLGLSMAHHAYLIVDEAHSTGIYGEEGAGLTVKLGISEQIFARIHTFGKGVGVHGACIASSATVRDYLINFARPLIYTTASPPLQLISILESIALIRKMNRERSILLGNILQFQEEVRRCPATVRERYILNESPIQGIQLNDAGKCKKVCSHLREEGYNLFPILSPTVPAGRERIRICLHSYNNREEIVGLINVASKLIQ